MLGPTKRFDEFVESGGDDLSGIGLFAVEPDMASNRVPHSPSGELSIVGGEHGLLVVGIVRDLIIDS